MMCSHVKSDQDVQAGNQARKKLKAEAAEMKQN